jgi:hypothetical protein
VRRSNRVVLAGLTALGIAACGSGSPSVDQFRLSATQICRSTTIRTARIATPASPSGAVTFLRRGLAVLSPELQRLRRLQAPRRMAREYATALAGFSAELGALRAAVRQLSGGADPVSTTAALQQRLSPIESRGDRAWGGLDLPACRSR